MRPVPSILSLFTITAASVFAASPQANPHVLGMNPTAYWPANDGAGDVLHDVSGNDNHGEIHHVAWDGNWLDFRGSYQWLLIPARGALRSRDFSMGGWLYLNELPGGSWRNMPGRTGLTFFGNSNVNGRPWLGAEREGLSLFVRWNAILDVSIDGRRDALNTRERHFDLGRGRPVTRNWHHLLLTYEAASQTLRLYGNGVLLTEQAGINYVPAARPFHIGSDADWWFQSNTSGSLNGSVRELVFFNRALDANEVNHLFQVSNPLAGATPTKQAAHNGNALESRVYAVSQNTQQGAFEANTPSQITVCSEQALDSVAEQLLAKINANGVYLPRIEDFKRNMLLAQLLRSESDSRIVNQAISRGLVEPLAARLDTNDPATRRIFLALEQGRPREALAHYRALHDGPQPLVSQGDVLRDARPRGPTENVRAYTPQVKHNGTIFKVGTGIPWQGVEPVPATEFREIRERLAREFPEAADWGPDNARNIFRVPLTRIDPDGTSTTLYLEGPEFILDATDEKLKGWSIAIDNDGYIHLTGGMHNAPNPRYFIPGSWERLGLSRDRNNPDFPRAMVWVSTRPYDLESLVFVGQRNNPQCPPVPDGLNYMNYVQDRNGELYIYTRIGVAGIQSWGLYHYNTTEKRWSAIGGQPKAIIDDTLGKNPGWERFLARPWGHVSVPSGEEPPTLAWAWQAHFYNYIRDPRSVQFDLDNRMHVWLRLFALDGEGRHLFRNLYAFSDDSGKSFRRVDGTPVALPLTLNPAPNHQADATLDNAERWWQLWASIYHFAGYRVD